jgi:hypothetical protein
MVFRNLENGLVLSFLAPLSPSDIQPGSKISLEEAWPGAKRETEPVLILSPDRIVLGLSGAKDGFEPVSGPGEVVIERDGKGFRVVSVSCPVSAGGVALARAPVMRDVGFSFGDCPVSFSGGLG